jgi:hypothetical protein
MRTPPAIWLLTLSIGCGGTEPIELADDYELRTVEDHPPPRLIGATLECDVSVEGGRVTFGPGEQFELGLDLLTDCSRGGGSQSRETNGYTGTAEVSGTRVVFHAANGAGPITFEGVVVANGNLQASVPGLVPTADAVAVEFEPN